MNEGLGLDERLGQNAHLGNGDAHGQPDPLRGSLGDARRVQQSLVEDHELAGLHHDRLERQASIIDGMKARGSVSPTLAPLLKLEPILRAQLVARKPLCPGKNTMQFSREDSVIANWAERFVRGSASSVR